jgi:hypothetical protein
MTLAWWTMAAPKWISTVPSAAWPPFAFAKQRLLFYKGLMEPVLEAPKYMHGMHIYQELAQQELGANLVHYYLCFRVPWRPVCGNSR